MFWRKPQAMRKEPEEQETIEFRQDDDVFLRAKKILYFAGMVNPSRLGLDNAVAEGLSIYQKLDKEYQEQTR